ncbi:MAG: flagellar filament capping protein FliD [Pusillimonas sp.]
MAISSIGVGSGLPLQELLTDLRTNESQVLNTISARQKTEQSRVSAYGTIKSAVETLQTSSRNLAKAETFGAMKATVNGDGVSASVDATAIAGNYAVKVETLATSQSLVTSGAASRTDAIGTGGEITLTLGDGSTKTLDLTGGDTSVNGLIAAINSDESLGVQATVINDGDPANPYRLMLTATGTGTDAAVTKIEVSGNTDLANLLNFDAASTDPQPVSEQAATNAKISINGIDITSQTNTIEDVIEGVTLTLNTADPAQTINLSVSRDDSAASKAITNFVNAYNALQGTVRSLTSYNTETQQGSTLTGDAVARRVQEQVRGILSVSAPDGDIRSLADLGIEFNYQNGELTLDNAKLSEALKNNLSDVTGFLNGSGGITERMGQITGDLLSARGPINSASNGASETVKELARQYETTSLRIDERMATYQKQFAALDSMIAQMNSVSSYLTTQLAGLESLSSQKK